MILYTEKQLSEAYGRFIKKLPLVDRETIK